MFILPRAGFLAFAILYILSFVLSALAIPVPVPTPNNITPTTPPAGRPSNINTTFRESPRPTTSRFAGLRDKIKYALLASQKTDPKHPIHAKLGGKLEKSMDLPWEERKFRG